MGATTSQAGCDTIAKELAYFCVVDPKEYYKVCEELEGVERRRCQNRISFAFYCVRKTGLVYESNGGLLVLVPCILTFLSLYGQRKTGAVRKDISKLLTLSGIRVELSTEDIRSAAKSGRKSPLYIHLKMYADNVAKACLLFKQIHHLLRQEDSVDFYRAVSVLALGHLAILLSTMTLRDALNVLNEQRTPTILKECTIKSSEHLHDISAKNATPTNVRVLNTLAVYSDVLKELVNTFLDIHIIARGIGELSKEMLHPRASSTRAKFVKYMIRKLLYYNLIMRLCSELNLAATDLACLGAHSLNSSRARPHSY